MSTLLDDYPYFNNLHTRTQALGLAILDHSIYYLSTAGPGTSCKSIWSSLVSNRGKLDCGQWRYDLVGASDLHTVYQGLPNSNFQHMVSMHKGTNFLIAADPKAAQFYDELDIEHVESRKRMFEQHMPAILTRFADYLNTQTNVPILREWAPELWAVGIDASGITQLDAFGDCLGAWLIKEEYDWLGTVQALLRQARLHFPPEV
jgi:hypothetical protein